MKEFNALYDNPSDALDDWAQQYGLNSATYLIQQVDDSGPVKVRCIGHYAYPVFTTAGSAYTKTFEQAPESIVTAEFEFDDVPWP